MYQRDVLDRDVRVFYQGAEKLDHKACYTQLWGSQALHITPVIGDCPLTSRCRPRFIEAAFISGASVFNASASGGSQASRLTLFRPWHLGRELSLTILSKSDCCSC